MPDDDVVAVEEDRYQKEDPTHKTWMPTRKWFAALAGAAASIAASWIVTGEFDDVERGMVGTALVALTAAFFKGNEDTPGGVPRKE
jgi:hypothetical protein